MKKLLIIIIFIFSNLHAEENLRVPTDLEQNPDFQYVVKVLGISNDPVAIEKLSFQWEGLLKIISYLKEPLSKYELIKKNYKNLKPGGQEMGLGLMFGLGVGSFLDIGVGYLDRGFSRTPHLRLGARFLAGDVFGGAAVGVHRNIHDKPDEPLLDASEVDTGAAYVFLGGGSVSASEFNEKMIGLGFGFFLSKMEFGAYGLRIPLFFPLKTPQAARLAKLSKLIPDLIFALQSLQLTEAREKAEHFNIEVSAIFDRLKDRWKDSPPAQLPPPSDLHPLANLQNLFEPSLLEKNSERNKLCAKRAKELAYKSK